MIQFGYILNINLFTPRGNDLIWPVSRYNEDQSITNYHGIQTMRDLSEDDNIIIKGDGDSFNDWIGEFYPYED